MDAVLGSTDIQKKMPSIRDFFFPILVRFSDLRYFFRYFQESQGFGPLHPWDCAGSSVFAVQTPSKSRILQIHTRQGLIGSIV